MATSAQWQAFWDSLTPAQKQKYQPGKINSLNLTGSQRALWDQVMFNRGAESTTNTNTNTNTNNTNTNTNTNTNNTNTNTNTNNTNTNTNTNTGAATWTGTIPPEIQAYYQQLINGGMLGGGGPYVYSGPQITGGAYNTSLWQPGPGVNVPGGAAGYRGGFDYTPQYRADNSVFTRPTNESWLPGMMPTLVAQIMQGVPEYYPYFDVAPKTDAQILADEAYYALGQDGVLPGMMLGSLQDLMGGFQNFGVDGTTELLAQMLSDPSMLPGGDFAQLGMNAAQQGMPMFGDQIAMMQQGIDPFINDRLSYFANQGAWDHAIKPANRMIDLGEDATGFARNLMSGGPQFDYGFNNFGLTDFMGGYRSSPYTESVIGGLQSDAQRFLGENALRRDREQAIQTGQYGGSRGEIAEGISERGVGEEFLQQAAALRDQDYARYLSNKLQAGQQLTSADIQAQQVGAQRGGIGADYGINVGNLMNQLIGTGGQIGSTYAGLVGDIEASRMGQGIGQQGNTANAIANYLQAGQGMYGTGWDSLLGLGTLGTQLGQVGNQANQINQQGLQMGMEGIPALFAMMMGQGDLLRNIGTRDQALNQRFIDSDVNRWNYQQNAPMDLINNWANILNGVQATPNQTQTKNQLGALDYALAFAGGGDDSPLSTIAKIFG